MYGFGAILPNGEDPNIKKRINPKTKEEEKSYKHTNHCFAMNGDASNPQVKGLSGVLRTYRNATPIVEMWGPTEFSGFLGKMND